VKRGGRVFHSDNKIRCLYRHIEIQALGLPIIVLFDTILLLHQTILLGSPMDIPATVKAFDHFLAKESCAFEAIIIGGAALSILGITSRVTNDIDVMRPGQLPQSVKSAAHSFALHMNLPENWLNCGPADIEKYLPHDWEKRVVTLFNGKHLKLITLGRQEFLMTKCWAYCDRERDLDDILAMKPSTAELDIVVKWLEPLDANPAWPSFVKKMIDGIRARCEGNHG
jgi:hypothetical protein